MPHVYVVIGTLVASVALVWLLAYVGMQVLSFPLRLWWWIRGEGFRD